MRVETIELSNSGNADLNISSLSIEGGSFSADVQAPLRIAPGGVREVGLQFSPIEAGVHSAALTIESDALGSSSSTTIQLQVRVERFPSVRRSRSLREAERPTYSSPILTTMESPT